MAIHPDQQYVDALLHNDRNLIEDIYRRFSATVRNYVLKNGGDTGDAADIFQESLIDIYNQARHRQLQLTCPFEPFLLLVCKRKWLNELKKRGHSPVTKPAEDVSDFGEDTFAAAERVASEEDRHRAFREAFDRLGERCREILRSVLTGERQEKIAEALGVSYGYLRKKKTECMATLLSHIQSLKL
ncbi:RNA polymerase sigma factor [Dinghuibacter silviterrae]|uniref:RNA polymerase sigma factor (Sigma-70 family) n=1 Tax=Dinghuibacter silviterrae TaxID=1539049 RepID=A0A4V3GKY2_9BACT|nr:sigma-70 family RNA polymerase sigma factor [Dinghuibacter silviterrae]TDW97432.1 RNA polymerase sigma factor (sigma-70 family) [Dinghuibacter silviterrae]